MTRRDVLKAGAGLAAILASGRAPAAVVRSMLAARASICGGKKLPYDSEVEYLETTGTQFINTNADANKVYGLEFDFCILSGNSSGYKNLINSGYDDYSFAMNGYNGNNANMAMSYRGSQLFATGAVKLPTNEWFKLSIREGVVKIPGYYESSLMELPIAKYKNATLVIANYNTGSINRSAKMRIGPLKLYAQDDSLMRDLAPWRFMNELGQSEGAMYNRLGTGGMNPDGSARTDGIYRNRGTGAFIYGPDAAYGASAANGGGYKHKCVRRSYTRSWRPSARFCTRQNWKEAA